jgi:hypothetical protein
VSEPIAKSPADLRKIMQANVEKNLTPEKVPAKV